MWIANQEKQRHDDQTVNCVRYDPGSGRALASCGMDGIVQVRSSYNEETDDNANATGPFATMT